MHQHGPQCRHGHGHGQNAPPPQNDIPPSEYFSQLQSKWKDKRVFFWQQVLHGVVIDRLYEKWGLSFMRSFNCQPLQMIANGLQNATRCEFVPSRLRHITSGMLLPLLVLFFFNYNVLVGVTGQSTENESSENYASELKFLMEITILVYILVGLRGSSILNNQQLRSKSKEIYKIRPYLQSPQMTCGQCGIVRMFRAAHCPFCKSCIAKHTRHSLVWGICIGGANELLALLFFMSSTVTFFAICLIFHWTNKYGAITKIMFYAVNIPLFWQSFVQALTFFVFNVFYNITEQELRIWPAQQYLLRMPDREFQNNVDQGFAANLTQSIYACLGVSSYESKQFNSSTTPIFQPYEQNRKYIINWDKAHFYLIPMLMTHKNRQQIIQMMAKEQPRMIQMFKLQARFKSEVLAELNGQQVNEFQLQQRVAMKMQAHIAQHMPQMAPNPQQQKIIQLQMLNHMKRQFSSEPDLAIKIEQLINNLQGQKLTPIETNVQMRQLQQELMGRRMGRSINQQQQKLEQSQSKPEKQARKQGSKEKQQEQAPMVRVADEDL